MGILVWTPEAVSHIKSTPGLYFKYEKLVLGPFDRRKDGLQSDSIMVTFPFEVRNLKRVQVKSERASNCTVLSLNAALRLNNQVSRDRG